jgi:macrolide-specific efflux system membrane fusion protein
MRYKKLKIFFVFLILLAIAAFIMLRLKPEQPNGEIVKEIIPVIGAIKNFISTTGTVLPKNRLEVKPPVNGRVENILVQEGEKVKVGQTLAWMSSTERAALLDAARGQGDEALKHWQEVYKAIPLISPIDGEVIVATTQSGQTVTTSDPVVVLSDRLIVRAQVDETDIGKIKPDMKAVITLDAYQDSKINALVQHIYYESKTVNNVTIYEVDLLPEEVPLFFRSGMNATVDFIEQDKKDILLLPAGAVQKENNEAYCLVRQDNGAEPVRVRVTLGITDDKFVEILSGITEKDRIILKSKAYSLPKSTREKNPFMPGH